MTKSIGIFIVMLILCVSVGCNRSAPHAQESEIQRLRIEGLEALNAANANRAIEIGRAMLDSTSFDQASNNYFAAIYGRVILGQAYFLAGKIPQSYKLLHQAEELSLKHRNDSALASVYNGLGLYYASIERNNNTSLSYFFKGLEAAKRAKNHRLHSILLTNISGIYSLCNDPHAIHYAKESYYYGKSTNDTFLQYIGAISSAIAYTNSGEYDQALKFFGEAETLLHSNNINDLSNLYYNYGVLYERMGNAQEAQYYYEQALTPKDIHQRDVRAYTVLAGIYNNKGYGAKAERLLREALDVTEDGYDKMFRPGILKMLAEVLRKKGDIAGSRQIGRQKEYEDSVASSAATKQMIDHLKFKYDIERTENALNRRESELKYSHTINYMLLGFSILIIIASICIYLMYYRKNQLYRAIVRQLSESAMTEESLRHTIRQMEEENQSVAQQNLLSPPETQNIEEKDDTNPTTIDIPDSLRIKFEVLMENKEVYTDKSVSKDMVAKLLDTNRTYVSKLVNKVYRMSFPEFINSLRIREAIRRLSDMTDDIPLKTLSDELGYNSMTTFYNKFKEETGMTPATFRQKARTLSPARNKTEQ